jgi:hypothetical protein
MINKSEPKLLDQVQNICRLKYYSRSTEKNYILWIKRFILFHNIKHPAEMGEKEIGTYLSFLAQYSKMDRI